MPDPSSTLVRRTLSGILRDGFLGAAHDQTSLCPVAIPGVRFDPGSDADCSPFTSAAVLSTVGYVELSLREVDSWPDGVTSGLATFEGEERMMSGVYTLLRCRFSVRVPRSADFVEEAIERYQETIRGLFFGLRLALPGPPAITLRQMQRNPPRVWGDRDDGDWRRRDYDIPIRFRERLTHAA